MAETTPPRETDAVYRKRAETAPLTLTEGPWGETISEAVYWPREGYGGKTRCETREHAEAEARRDLMLGYGREPAKCRVHIIETRTRVIEVSISDVE